MSDMLATQQTVSPTASTAHASLVDDNIETLFIPRAARVPSDMGALMAENAGVSNYYAKSVAETIAPKRK